MPNVSEEELKNMSPEQIMELQKKNCIFCKMIAGEIPAYKVFEDDKVFAILDINPANEGHVLLLPKEHYQILPQVPPELLGHILIVAKKISNMMLTVMRVKGTSLLFEVGEAAGQKAPHVMLHIIPSNPNNKILQPELVSQDPNQYDQVLKLLRSKTGFKVIEETKKPVEKKAKAPKEKVKEKLGKEFTKKDFDLDKISKLFD
jgi:histidine triad (HIT) family protein